MKKDNTPYLELADNMFGKLKPDVIKRINKFLRNPTTAGWEDIHCIIIDNTGKMHTIWNVVIYLLPFFPTSGRVTNDKGEVVRDWEQVPTPEEVTTAINKHLLKREISTQLN